MKHIRAIAFHQLPLQMQAHETAIQIGGSVLTAFVADMMTDKYSHYHMTHIRPFSFDYLSRPKRALLQLNKSFRTGRLYVGTGVQLLPDNTLKTRTFFFNQEHVNQMGFGHAERGVLGDGNSVISAQAHTFKTRGQIIKYIPNSFPLVLSVTPADGQADIPVINQLLPHAPKEAGMEWKFQNPGVFGKKGPKP